MIETIITEFIGMTPFGIPIVLYVRQMRNEMNDIRSEMRQHREDLRKELDDMNESIRFLERKQWGTNIRH